MVKKKMGKRICAASLAAILGFLSIWNGDTITKGLEQVFAADDQVERQYFAQGAGTGSDFSVSSWKFAGRALGESEYDVQNAYNGAFAPGIVEDTLYLQDNSKVIRLIQGVKAEAGNSKYEASTKSNTNPDGSYVDYRTGQAFIKQGFDLNSDADFSVKFTFSMPEAVVNTTQTGGEEYAREVGGDGIAFVMTTKDNQTTQVGSGIGYQGMTDSLAIELDSFYNGIYYYKNGDGSNNLDNWDFDNQVYLHDDLAWEGNSTYTNIAPEYGNYVNKSHEERFDHIAITLDGNVKDHTNGLFYLNNINPTKFDEATKQYTNLAYRSYNSGKDTGTANASSASDCATRFTDAGVNTRLFTVWVDYDGQNKTMSVSIANGDFTNAVKPDTAQIVSEIDLQERFGGQTVYLGFTSAVGSSKANHTIHSFEFTNAVDTSFNVEYYFENSDGNYPDNPNYSTTIDTINGNAVKTYDEVTDEEYRDYSSISALKNYTGYEYDSTATGKVSKIEVAADGTSTLKLYYAVPDQLTYNVEYYFETEVNSGKYEKNTSLASDITNVSVNKYAEVSDTTYQLQNLDGYQYNASAEGAVSSIQVLPGGENTLKLYYDKQAPQTADCVLIYHKFNKEKNEYEKESAKSATATANIGVTVTAEQLDKDYASKYADEFYELSKTHEQTVEVTLDEVGKTYEMHVYYDPIETQYTLIYYKYNPVTGKFETGEPNKTKGTGYIGDSYKIEDIDAEYESHYGSDYEVNKDESYQNDKTLVKDADTNVMRVYYYPKKTTYTTEYYLEQNAGQGDYELDKTVSDGKEYFIGTPVTAEVIDYDGYVHTNVTGSTNESDTVQAGGATVLKVYYNKVEAEPEMASYVLHYYKLNKKTGTYDYVTSTDAVSEKVGTTVTITDADENYETKYAEDYYEVNTDKNTDWTVTLTEAGTTYEMNVYYDPMVTTYKTVYYLEQEDGSFKQEKEITTSNVYPNTEVEANILTFDGYTHELIDGSSNEKAIVNPDGTTVLEVYYTKNPVPQMASYVVNYYKKDKDTQEYKLADETDKVDAEVGTKVQVEQLDENYASKYAEDFYQLSESHEQTLEVTLDEAGTTYYMNVYYDPVETQYTLVYHKYNPVTKKFEKAETNETIGTGYIGDSYEIEDIDADYESHYGNDYEVNKDKSYQNDKTLVENPDTNVMHVYYYPKLTTYKTEYYLEQTAGQGDYQLDKTVSDGKEYYIGTPVTAKVKKYDGYVHTTVTGSTNESDTVQANGATVLKVYYSKVEVQPDMASYELNYYKLIKGTDEYEYITSTPLVSEEVGTTVSITDADEDYETKFAEDYYEVNTDKNTDWTVKLTDAGTIYEMNVYYDPIETQYTLIYHKYNPVTGEFETGELNETKGTGYIGDSYEIEDIDADYETHYGSDYEVDTENSYQNDKTLVEDAETNKMHVYYYPKLTTYTTEYYLEQTAGQGDYELDETVSDGKEYFIGTPVTAEVIDYDGYVHTNVTGSTNESDTVQANGATVLKVYYNKVEVQPEMASYVLHYYKLNKETGTYDYVTSTDAVSEEVGTTVSITDADENYETKYAADYYEVNKDKNTDWTVTLTDAGTTYEMNVYYDPIVTSYKTVYYLEQEDGSFKQEDERITPNVYPNTEVKADIITYVGYTHELIDELSNEEDIVNPDGTTVLEVYYTKNPVPQMASYVVNYYKKDKDTQEYELADETDKVDAEVGTKVQVEQLDENYASKYAEDFYQLSDSHEQTLEVTLDEAGTTYYMNVYYDPVETQYTLIYHKYNPVTKDFETGEQNETVGIGYIGDSYEIDDIDADYEIHYGSDYEVDTKNSYQNDKTLVEDVQTNVMHVYYYPKLTTYKTEYYLEQTAGQGDYQLDDTVSDDKEYFIGTPVTAEVKVYDGYVHTNVTGSTNESDTVQADGATVLKVYYNKVEAEPEMASYVLHYYKLNKETGMYDYITSTDAVSEKVGTTVSITDADEDYETKFAEDYYEVNTDKNTDWTVKLTDAGTIYEMNVYYDPMVTSYKTVYYFEQEDGVFIPEKEIVTPDVYPETEVIANILDFPDYTHELIEGMSHEEDIVNPDGTTELRVYYKHAQASYLVDYYKFNKDTQTYEKVDSTEKTYANVGTTVSVKDVEESYATRYEEDRYELSSTHEQLLTVTLEEADQTYHMSVYYDPVKTSYTTVYYLQQADGSFKRVESTYTEDCYAGENVKAEILDFDGYQHEQIEGMTVEEEVVLPDGSTELRVYYVANTSTTPETPQVTEPATPQVTTPATQTETTEAATPSTENSQTEQQTTSTPKTGDHHQAVLWTLMMLLAALLCGGSVVSYKKKRMK